MKWGVPRPGDLWFTRDEVGWCKYFVISVRGYHRGHLVGSLWDVFCYVEMVSLLDEHIIEWKYCRFEDFVEEYWDVIR